MSTYELDDDLVRAIVDKADAFGGNLAALVIDLRSQLPARPIEEGCRVRRNAERDGLALVGVCGKPFHGRVLVKWDGDPGALSYGLIDLTRID